MKIKLLPHKRGFKFKYLSPTSKRGSRIRVSDQWFGGSVLIPFNSIYNTAWQNAAAYLVSKGFEIQGFHLLGNDNEGIILVSGWDSERRIK